MTETTQHDRVNDSIDGRTLRRTRNRTAVITALLDMIREGDLRPAAADIADRAGVSHRSIFRYFDDLDDLVHTAIDQAFIDASPLSDIPDIGAPTLTGRIATLVDARLALVAHVDGPMQVARMRAQSIPSIDDRIALIATTFRTQIADHFATNLAAHDETTRDRVVDAILVLTSYDAYSIHLRLLDHDVEAIRLSWNTALHALLDT